nr:MAG TPA: hypothetical protein [Caudoviricetes sp.]
MRLRDTNHYKLNISSLRSIVRYTFDLNQTL